MTYVQKNYSNKYSCHLFPVCKLEEETMHHLVACNLNMSVEDFGKANGNESCGVHSFFIRISKIGS